MIPRTLALLLALGATATSVLGQSPERSFRGRFVYFERFAQNPAKLYVPGPVKGEPIEVEPSLGVGTEPVLCPLDASGKLVISADEGGERVVATATVPRGVEQAVLFMLADPGGSGAGPRYRVLVVDESINGFPKGGAFICNLAPDDSRFEIGESKVQLRPGQSDTLGRPEGIDEYNMAPFRVWIRKGETWADVKDSLLRCSEKERYFLFTLVSRTGARPTVKIYKQAVPAGMAVPADPDGRAVDRLSVDR